MLDELEESSEGISADDGCFEYGSVAVGVVEQALRDLGCGNQVEEIRAYLYFFRNECCEMPFRDVCAVLNVDIVAAREEIRKCLLKQGLLYEARKRLLAMGEPVRGIPARRGARKVIKIYKRYHPDRRRSR